MLRDNTPISFFFSTHRSKKKKKGGNQTCFTPLMCKWHHVRFLISDQTWIMYWLYCITRGRDSRHTLLIIAAVIYIYIFETHLHLCIYIYHRLEFNNFKQNLFFFFRCVDNLTVGHKVSESQGLKWLQSGTELTYTGSMCPCSESECSSATQFQSPSAAVQKNKQTKTLV